MGTGKQGDKKLEASPSWAQTPVSPSGIYTHWVTHQVHVPDRLYTHGHSPCFADTAGRTAEPSGTEEVVYCPQHCGSSPGLESRRKFEERNDAFPASAPRKSALNDSDPSVIWHSVTVSSYPSPSHPQVPNKQLLSHFTKKTESSDNDVYSFI